MSSNANISKNQKRLSSPNMRKYYSNDKDYEIVFPFKRITMNPSIKHHWGNISLILANYSIVLPTELNIAARTITKKIIKMFVTIDSL